MIRYLLLLTGLIILVQPHAGAQDSSLRYEILLNNKMPGDSIRNISFSDCIDVSPESLLTLSDGSIIYLLGWGGIVTLGNKSNTSINSFAYSSDGLLFAIAGSELCHLNKDGNWKSLFSLPGSQMSIARGKEVMYIYDHKPGKGKYRTYALAKGGKYKDLFSSSKPISAICEMDDSVYVAIESGLYSYSPLSGKLKAVFALEKENAITSLSADAEKLILYLSTHRAIYALKNNTLIKLSTDFPGSIIKYSGKGLLIFNPQTKDILHIVDIEKSIDF